MSVARANSTKPDTIQWRNQKSTGAKSRRKRPISCKDLGGGDCEGWLMKKSDKKWRNWTKYWFVLKDKNLYYFKHPTDDSYMGMFRLTGFTVDPAPNEKHHAFKIQRGSTAYVFASDRQSDMVKWMNKLVGAAILDPHPEDPETEEENEEEHFDEFPAEVGLISHEGNEASSEEEVHQMFKSIRISQCDILAGGMPSARRTFFLDPIVSPTVETMKPSLANDKASHLLALRRTVKDKEQELAALNSLLSREPITRESLFRFRLEHQSLYTKIQSEVQRQQTANHVDRFEAATRL